MFWGWPSERKQQTNMKMIQITEDKVTTMSGLVEKMLHYGGKLMSCIEEMEGGAAYGERHSGGMYGERRGMEGRDGGMYGERRYDDDEMYGERRMRDSYGRYR